MRGLVIGAAVIAIAMTVPVNGTDNVLVWSAGRLVGTWVIDTTPNYKGHGQQGMNAVCVNSISSEVRLVPITEAQAYGDPVTGTAPLQQDTPCPRTP